MNDKPELHEVLVELDPARHDDLYWGRFHRSVMRRVADELARRRRMADLTVSGMVSSWARAVIPTAVVAAAAAALVLLEPVPTPPAPDLGAGVEEVLADGLEGDPIPTILADEALPEGGGVQFAVAEIF